MNRGDKRGVAILIVIGMLAVLTLAAIAFSISMRVERKGASNFRDSIQARHMLGSALSAAIDDINRNMDSPGFPFALYPEWDLLASTQVAYWGSNTAPVVSRSGIEYVQGASGNANTYRARVESLITSVTSNGPFWTAIDDTSGQVRGRFAYIAVNCSGMLDANLVGGTNHTVGASPREIQVGVLPEFGNKTNDFARTRDTHLRYETLPELVALNGSLKSNDFSFDVYSLAPDNQILRPDMTITNKVYIGPQTNLWRMSDITNALIRSGVPASRVLNAYYGLVDYCDSNSIPTTNATYGCMEAVPMINEVMMPVCSLTVNGSNFVEAVGLGIGLFSPFVNTIGLAGYSLNYDIRFQNNGVGNPAFVPTVTVTGTVALAGSAGPGNAYTLVPVAPPIQHQGAFAGSTNVDYFIYVSAYLTDVAGQRVDEVPSPYNPPMTRGARLHVVGTAIQGMTNFTDWCECLDPRFNWDPENLTWGLTGSSFKQWYRGEDIRMFSHSNYTFSAHGPGVPGAATNQNRIVSFAFHPTAFPWNGPGNPWDLDDDTDMYVANRPLRTVGESGYICYDIWKTIRLYDHRFTHATNDLPNPYTEMSYCHTVLDNFTVYPLDCPGARGLVNVNTWDTNVLASVFVNVPPDEYNPGTVSGLATNTARTVAWEVYNHGPYTNLSSMGTFEKGLNWPSWVSGSTEIARESLLRNSAGLLTVRHNQFTILLLADAYSAGLGNEAQAGSILASARAVAQVWRDPYPLWDNANRRFVTDGSGRRVHRWFLRYWRILDD